MKQPRNNVKRAKYGHLAEAPAGEVALDTQRAPEDDTEFKRHNQWLHDRLGGCYEDNWDGNGAKAVSGPAVSAAAAFLAKLPREEAEFPEVEADNDGWVTLEWHLSSDNVVHVCFGPNGVGAYASLLKGARSCGEFKINEKSIDERVMGLLRRFEDISSQAQAN